MPILCNALYKLEGLISLFSFCDYWLHAVLCCCPKLIRQKYRRCHLAFALFCGEIRKQKTVF